MKSVITQGKISSKAFAIYSVGNDNDCMISRRETICLMYKKITRADACINVRIDVKGSIRKLF